MDSATVFVANEAGQSAAELYVAYFAHSLPAPTGEMTPFATRGSRSGPIIFSAAPSCICGIRWHCEPSVKLKSNNQTISK